MGVTAVGLIGLGNMGGRIAQRLRAAGIDVLGYDPRSERVTAAGARAAASANDVVRARGVVLLSLPDSRAVEAVMLGSGAESAVSPGQVFIDLSTSEPSSTRRIGEALESHGAEFIDAGISGGASAAETGELTLMVGAGDGEIDGLRDVLGAFSARVICLGERGAGHTAKLLNNFLNAVALAATAEVMVAGKRAGLDLQALLDVFNSSSGINFATLHRFPKIIHGDYLEGGLTNALMLKDVTAYTQLAADLGVASLNAAGPVASFGLANALGYADRISNTVVDAIGDVSGHTRLHNREDGA